LAGFSGADPGGAAAKAIITMIGGVIIFCPIAFAIGYFNKENKRDGSNLNLHNEKG
jgi:hypothetical protein